MDSVEIRIFTLPLHFCILLLSEGDTTKSYNDKLTLFKYIQFLSFFLPAPSSTLESKSPPSKPS